MARLMASKAGGASLQRLSVTRSRRTMAVVAASKNVLITGGNTGIGFETAKELCKRGDNVIIACRDDQKAKAAIDKCRAAVPGASISSVNIDLSDLSSVRDCAKELLDSGKPLDVLLNNAGVMATPKMSTKDGFEFQLGINHLGHFLLTNLLLPGMTADTSRPKRIINVASAAHAFGKIDFDDLMRDKNYQPWDAYGQSKLANIMFTYQLAKRLKPADNITVNALHPGVVRTELGRYMVDGSNAWFMGPAIAVAQLFFKTPEQGAQTSIHLASSPELEGVTSKYFVDCRPVSSMPASYDTAVAAKLWDVSAELVKL